MVADGRGERLDRPGGETLPPQGTGRPGSERGESWVTGHPGASVLHGAPLVWVWVLNFLI